MQLLFRPYSGRTICGVAIGVAERYGFSVTLIRIVFIAALIISPISVLLYLALALSIPSEHRIVERLHVLQPNATMSPRERFEQSADLLSERLIGKHSGPAIPEKVTAIALLFFAGILELQKIEGPIFYAVHPIVTTAFIHLSNGGVALFYCGIALLLLTQREHSTVRPRFFLSTSDRFVPERGSDRLIGGIVSGASRVMGLDPVYLRVALILLNFFTIGLAGVAYLGVWYAYRRQSIIPDTTIEINDAQSIPLNRFRYIVAAMFLLLAVFSLSTEYRLYFFNLSLLESAIFLITGLFVAWQGLRATEQSRLSIAIGAGLFFYGVYRLAISAAELHLTVSERFEMTEIAAALATAYVTLVALRRSAWRVGILVALAFAVAALLAAVNIVPPRYFAEIDRFYDFFYPALFAALGLWIAFER